MILLAKAHASSHASSHVSTRSTTRSTARSTTKATAKATKTVGKSFTKNAVKETTTVKEPTTVKETVYRDNNSIFPPIRAWSLYGRSTRNTNSWEVYTWIQTYTWTQTYTWNVGIESEQGCGGIRLAIVLWLGLIIFWLLKD